MMNPDSRFFSLNTIFGSLLMIILFYFLIYFLFKNINSAKEMPSFAASFALFLILNNILIAESTFGVEYWGIPTVMAVGASLYKNFDKFLGCRFSECCSLRTGSGGWMPVNISGLASSLDNNLHGQHLVKNIVLKSLKAHFSNRDPSKALVLSFHGWTGSGKNFVSKMIAESIYQLGLKSKFVHLFVSTVHFPHEDKADIYKLQIQDWIRGNVSDCENSLFIFDEIDKMPVGMIDGIKPFIDYHESIFGVNFRKSVFLFLSNTGSREIIQKTLQNWKEGKERTSISYSDMEELIQKGAFNEQGGLHQSDLIHHSLIDFYVPFLPLERKHIELCILDEIRSRGLKPTKEFIKKVADDMIYFPPENQLFSTKGCKSVSSKVGFMLNEDIYEGMFN